MYCAVQFLHSLGAIISLKQTFAKPWRFQLSEEITLSKNRDDFEKRVLKDYKKQADLALKYVKIIYGLDFPRY